MLNARTICTYILSTLIYGSIVIYSLIVMSHIRCIICGKDSAVSGFDPSKLDRDIYVRQVRGKGYPGGWDHGPDISVLGDDEFTPKIMDRCFDLRDSC